MDEAVFQRWQQFEYVQMFMGKKRREGEMENLEDEDVDDMRILRGEWG